MLLESRTECSPIFINLNFNLISEFTGLADLKGEIIDLANTSSSPEQGLKKISPIPNPIPSPIPSPIYSKS